MKEYEITTAQNVTLRYEYASLGERLVAFIIDSLIKGGYLVAFGLLCLFLFRTGGLKESITGWVVISVIGSLPFVFYTLFFEYFTGGQTPGKRSVKIKVSSEDSQQLSFGKCLIRWLFRIVDLYVVPVFPGTIALVSIVVSKKKQRLGDLIAGTIVVSVRPEKRLEDTVYSYVPPARQVHYDQAAKLSAREVEIIKEVLRLYTRDGKYDLIPVTAERVRIAINAGPDMEDFAFLKTVVEDYNTLAATH